MALRYVSEEIVVNKLTLVNLASAASSEVVQFGMYDQNLNLVVSANFPHTALTGGGTALVVSESVVQSPAPTIVPGWYWFAFTSSNPTASFNYYGSSATAAPYTAIIKNANRICRGGNASSSGVLPATQTLTSNNDGGSGLFVVYEQ
jgi:hypothetical protein